MEPLVADIGDVLFGPWTMILVAVGVLAGLAVGLSLTIMKALELVEGQVAKTRERLGRKPGRVGALARRREVETRSRHRPSAPV